MIAPATSSTTIPNPESEFGRLWFEQSPDCVILLDAQGRLLSANSIGLSLLPQNFAGTSWIQIWNPSNRAAAEHALQQAKVGESGRFSGSLIGDAKVASRFWDVILRAIRDYSATPTGYMAVARDVTVSTRAERALRDIAEETAAATGDEFFHILARTAAKSLGARYAFMSETLSDLESRSLAFWEGTDFGKGFTYQFPGTPCQRVAAGHFCVTATGLREKFPQDLWLQQIGADSYVGVPMRNAAGRTIGHIAVLHTEPMDPTDDEVAILRIFAARACAELERKQADQRLSQAHTDLRRLNLEMSALLNINRAIGHHLQRNVLFGALADCLQNVVPTDRFGIELPAQGNLLHGYILTNRLARSEKLEPTVLPAEGTACQWTLQSRDWYVVASRDELRQQFPITYRVMVETDMQSLCALPLITGERVRGALFFMANARGAFAQLHKPFMEQVAAAVAVALDDCLAQEELRRLNEELAARKIADLERQKEHISEKLKEADEALNASEERFRDLFDEAPIAYVNEGLDSKFIRANRTAMKLLGIKPEDVPHTYGVKFAPDTPDAQRRMREAFESVGKGIDTSGVVLELRRKDNGKPLWVQWWSRPAPDGTYTRTMFVDITDRVLMEQEKARLQAQNAYLKEEILAEHNFTEIVGNSPKLLRVLQQIEQVAPADSTVLINGETGTGKELIARAIHDRSARKDRPLVKVNCGAISSGLVESELFGHVKGAFTGALSNRDGRFKVADGGTLFLDEVGELPLETQVKLLRVLQEREFEPIGSSKTVKVDVRIIAATNRDLDEAVRLGCFRSDLLYRLNVLPVKLPALRERREDIPLLAMFFLERFAKKFGKPLREIADEALADLMRYDWPGNIRELQNIMERAVVLSQGQVLKLPGDFGTAIQSAPSHQVDLTAKFESKASTYSANIPVALPPAGTSESPAALDEIQRRHIESVLNQTNWTIEGDTGAARILNMHPSTLRSRMQKFGIKRPSRPQF